MLSLNKRPPEIERDTYARFAAIPKADWAELYRDLWIQTHGEDAHAADPTAWMRDAEARRETLRYARQQGE